MVSQFRHLLRVLLWSVLPIILTVASGCTRPVYRVYSGPKRPLNEVAVLVPGPTVVIDEIDGKDLWTTAFGQEVHLLPGEHSIEAHYGVNYGTHRVIGGRLTRSGFFRKGHVYEVEGEIVPGGGIWGMQITHRGTVEEQAPIMAEDSLSPPHWRKFVERHSGDKSIEPRK